MRQLHSPSADITYRCRGQGYLGGYISPRDNSGGFRQEKVTRQMWALVQHRIRSGWGSRFNNLISETRQHSPGEEGLLFELQAASSAGRHWKLLKRGSSWSAVVIAFQRWWTLSDLI